MSGWDSEGDIAGLEARLDEAHNHFEITVQDDVSVDAMPLVEHVIGWLLAIVLSLLAGAFVAVNIILWRVV